MGSVCAQPGLGAAGSGAPQGRDGCEIRVVWSCGTFSVAGFTAIALSAKLLLDAHRVESPGVWQRNISFKLVLLP